MKSGRLEVLGLNDLPFDIKEVKDLVLDIMKANADTLVHLSINRAPLTVEFMNEFCDSFSAVSKLTKFEMRMPKEIEKAPKEKPAIIDHIEAFKAIAKMAEGKPNPIEVIISNHYGKYMTHEIQFYLHEEKPNLKISLKKKTP